MSQQQMGTISLEKRMKDDFPCAIIGVEAGKSNADSPKAQRQSKGTITCILHFAATYTTRHGLDCHKQSCLRNGTMSKTQFPLRTCGCYQP
eukprot:3803259-Amphidinium_carterae.2